VLLLEIYLATLLLACSYAYRNGGVTEKQGAGIMVVGSILTALMGTGWQGVNFGVLLVDLAVLVALVVLMLRTDKYWLLWMTAFHVIGVLTHIAKMIDPLILPRAYSIGQGFWAYPMLVALAMGVSEERRRREV
jgi:hypothetical protein